MSYAAIRPEFYQMMTPDSPWHSGAPGWSTAPWPGWGENPNLVGPPRFAVNGLRGTGGCGCSAVGEDDSVLIEPPPKPPQPKGAPRDPTLLGPWPAYVAVGLIASAAALLYFKPKFLQTL